MKKSATPRVVRLAGGTPLISGIVISLLMIGCTDDSRGGHLGRDDAGPVAREDSGPSQDASPGDEDDAGSISDAGVPVGKEDSGPADREDAGPAYVGTLRLQVTSLYVPELNDSVQVDVKIAADNTVSIDPGELNYSASTGAGDSYVRETGKVTFAPRGTFNRETGILKIREQRTLHETLSNIEGDVVGRVDQSEPFDYLYLFDIEIAEAILSSVTITDPSLVWVRLHWTLALDVSLVD